MIRLLWENLVGITDLRREIEFHKSELDALRQSFYSATDRAQERREALRQIAACERPGSNGTVRRMAKIARQAIGVSK